MTFEAHYTWQFLAVLTVSLLSHELKSTVKLQITATGHCSGQTIINSWSFDDIVMQ